MPDLCFVQGIRIGHSNQARCYLTDNEPGNFRLYAH